MALGTRNLLFIATLGIEWRDFLRTFRKEIPTMEPQELYTQVESALFDLPSSQTNDVTALSARVGQKRSLQQRIEGSDENNKRRKKDGKGKKKGGNGNNGAGFSGGFGSQPAPSDGKPKPPPRDPDRFPCVL
jgi:hypothetical protein